MNHPLVSVTKKFEFEACHSLEGYDGNCSRRHGHGYKLEITCKGTPNYKNLMVIDFKELKEKVKEHIIDILDHQDLNIVLHYLKRTTAEAISIWIAYFLIKDAGLTSLSKVKLWETSSSYAEYEISEPRFKKLYEDYEFIKKITYRKNMIENEKNGGNL